MARITITLPEADEPVTDQLARAIGDMPVLPSGPVDSRTVTLVGERWFLVAALFMIYGPDYLTAHDLVSTIEESAT